MSPLDGVTRGDRHSQGVQWVHLLSPRAEKKILGVIYRENLLVHPQCTKCIPKQSKSQFFRTFLLGGGDLEVH